MIDDRATDRVESIEELTTQAFVRAVENLRQEYGTWSDDWDWGWVMNNHVPHLTQTNGLGTEALYSGGGAESVNATRGTSGPSWRMIVELGPELKAWGVYPGGASGNPGSPNYDSMVEAWRMGQLYELNFYRNAPSNDDIKWSIHP